MGIFSGAQSNGQEASVVVCGVDGSRAERLAELADEENAELIVVGSRGHRLLRATFVGGVSSELIGLASCPVLVIPALVLPWGWEES